MAEFCNFDWDDMGLGSASDGEVELARQGKGKP